MIPSKLLNWLKANPNIHEYNDCFRGIAPCHEGSNNDTSFVVYKNGIWRCFSHQCHLKHGHKVTDLCKMLNLDSSDFVPTKSKIPKRTQNILCSISHWKKYYNNISKYAIDRGYSKYILKKYSIVDSGKDGRLKNRCCIPILSDNAQQVVGVTGRTFVGIDPKWYHYKFNCSHNLYNIWFAKTSIKNSKSVIITEGPFDCLAIVEAGVTNVVSTFGLQVSYIQQEILKNLNVERIILSFDNDDPGKLAGDKMSKILYKNFNNIQCIFPNKNDWGESSKEEIQELLNL